jgi:uncharacterized RDD family membrane protein YckC
VASSFVAALFVHNGDLPGLAGRLPGAWSLIPFIVNYVGGLVLSGQTLGMRLLGLRVVRTDNSGPVGLTRALVRTALLIMLVPAVIFDRNNRGLHDRVTDTAVVRI